MNINLHHHVRFVCVVFMLMAAIAPLSSLRADSKDPLTNSVAEKNEQGETQKQQTGNSSPYKIQWEKNILTIGGEKLPGKEMKVWYLEAYCRAGSTDRVWNETVIGHETELVSAKDDGSEVKLRCRVKDGIVVHHTIQCVKDGVEFRLKAHNPTDEYSHAQWVQPCIRVEKFTGCNQNNYLPKSFVFLKGKLERMPTKNWAMKARYIPGQVWCPAHVDRNDVNPRPLSSDVPSNGLIGCFSADESMMMATAWEPYQELFQGVIVCLHSDFRIGGLKPGETKQIRGKIYLVPNDVKALLLAYQQDFPEHHKKEKTRNKDQ